MTVGPGIKIHNNISEALEIFKVHVPALGTVPLGQSSTVHSPWQSVHGIADPS